MRHKPKSLIVGAGAVGRGLLAPVALNSGYRVLFIDTDNKIVSNLRARKWYPLAGRGVVHWIGPTFATIPDNLDFDFAIDVDDGIDIIFVSVRSQNLPDVAKFLSSQQILLKNNPIMYVVENLTNAAQKFADMFSINVRTRDAIANVIVPISPFENDDPLYTVYDPLGELVLEYWNEDELKESSVNHARYATKDDFAFEFDLKMHLHCSVHAVTACSGIRHEVEYIHEVITRSPTSTFITKDVVEPISNALQKMHPDKKHRIKERAKQEIKAMKNSLYMDDCHRVFRDPMRKLEPDDRLVGTASMLKEYDEYYKPLLMAIKIAIKRSPYDTPQEIVDTWNHKYATPTSYEIMEEVAQNWERLL